MKDSTKGVSSKRELNEVQVLKKETMFCLGQPQSESVVGYGGDFQPPTLPDYKNSMS